MENSTEHKYKTPEQIQEDLKHISPLALPSYLAECEYYDKSDACETLDKAIKEFDKQGGILKNLMDVMLPTTVQTVGTVVLKHTNKDLYTKAQRGKINFGTITHQIINFKYDENFLRLSKAGDELLHYKQKTENSRISDKYKRKEWDNEKRKDDFKQQYSENTDVIGQTVYKNQKEAEAAGSSVKNVLETDHIIPLKRIHDQYGSFAQRYVGQEKMNQIVNSDKNYQALNKSSNSSKNDRTNSEFADATKRRMEVKPDDPEAERKQKVIDSEAKLKQNEKDAQQYLNKELFKCGTETAIMEQLGRIIEAFVGPLAFEIKESIKEGICYNQGTDNVLDAIGKRALRIFQYMVEKLPALLGGFLGDLSQMLIHLGASMLNFITGIFKKFIGMIMSGISIIIEAVKVCCDKTMSPAQKGDAVSKLIVTLVVNVLGNFALNALCDALKIPEIISEIFNPIISAALSAIIIHLFDKLDLFNAKKELRDQRIDEIFALRRQKLEEASQQFDIAVNERFKQDRIAMEKIRTVLNSSLKNKDFNAMNEALEEACSLFQVEVPYKNTAEFLDFIRTNSKIVIA